MKKILIVNANYYNDISSGLIDGAKYVLRNNKKLNISIINAPGVFEIPFIIKKYISKFEAFIALGCVIKGQTPHFNFISKTTFDAIMRISVEYQKPIGNGIITALNMKQAKARSVKSKNRSKNTNKGYEAAKAVINLLDNGPKKF